MVKKEKRSEIETWIKYTVHVKCKNCGFNGDITILKGVKIKDQYCKECGCQTLQLTACL